MMHTTAHAFVFDCIVRILLLLHLYNIHHWVRYYCVVRSDLETYADHCACLSCSEKGFFFRRGRFVYTFMAHKTHLQNLSEGIRK